MGGEWWPDLIMEDNADFQCQDIGIPQIRGPTVFVQF